ncbi:class I tRNA ligase family protein [Streptomyces sp. NPDC101206]|uniref:class I tRNA ligase family protein n=1 Tax=Streptomyces sp. NPDC101206 TaxID=3366128 RepID=UPI003818602F
MTHAFLVTATPPTPNGDLHVGHLAGPYLAADVFCRAQRMLGNRARYLTGADHHQTYVVTMAQAQKRDPAQLAAGYGRDIRETLDLARIDLDAYTEPDDAYRTHVQQFFAHLHRTGRLARRTWTFPYDPATGRHLLEAFTTGHCPECLAATSGAICEICGHPNDPATLLHGTDNHGDKAPGQRAVDILVLPLEDYRDRIAAHYARHRAGMRPHVLRFVREMLSRPLPDFPISYPADWGIPVPVDGFPGQVLNVWAEMLPGLTHAAEDAWAEDSGHRLVQFLGYDNTFFFSIAHLCLGFAAGHLTAPTAIITNEFLHLAGSKFSTTRGHLVLARDLLARHGADAVRFGLALDHPEHQRADFTEAAFTHTVRTRLHQPLAVLRAALTGYEPPAHSTPPPFLNRYQERMLRAYTPETFSLREAAEATAQLLDLAAHRAAEDPALALHALHALTRHAAPLMPDLTAELHDHFG